MSVLALAGVCRSFPGVTALDRVDFTLRPGEIHALLGENGAGKSTLVKIMAGALQMDSGTIELDGTPISLRSTAHAQSVGISSVHQEVNLLPNLSVAHNLFLGREPQRFGLIDWRRTQQQSRLLLQRFALDIDVRRPLGAYSTAVQQLVAIVRALDMSARVLILDEPTASLDAGEVEMLFGILRNLKAQGLAIVFITHYLDQVYAVSDRISILRNGVSVGCFEAATLSRPALIEHMLGKELKAITEAQGGAQEAAAPAEAISMQAVTTVRRSIRDVSLAVGRGEAVGLAGLLGSGRTEVCRALFGVDQVGSGSIRYKGRPVRLRRPRDAIRLGLAMCPEDRKRLGIIGALSIRDNILLALQGRRGWLRPIKPADRQRLADRFIAELQISAAGAGQPVRTLSGGNQQKVILARWLATDPQVLILDEPTRGIDVGAHAEIIRLIRQLCDKGMSLLVTSSEIDELVAYAHRVAVMRDRTKVAELSHGTISEANILKAIVEA